MKFCRPPVVKHLVIAGCVGIACLSTCSAVAATSTTSPVNASAKDKKRFEVSYPSDSPLAKFIGRAADHALETAAGGDFAAAESEAKAALDLGCAYGTEREVDGFREAAFSLRLIKQLAQAPAAQRLDLLNYFTTHPILAHTLVFAVRNGNNIPGVYALADRLRRERPAQVDRFPELAMALCIVRDRGRHGFSEPNVKPADPLDVFDFYVNHEQKMFYGLRGVPVELLCYVVDNPAPLEDINWALNKYAGTAKVGSLFFKVAYDYDFWNGKSKQKLETVAGGYALPNILKVGGVCSDQAYFATTIGKSIGIPSAWTEGDSASMGHAWVGYLKGNGKSAAWNFNAGRYSEYQFVRGSVTDPQTGESLADSTVSLLGDLIGTNALQRQNAAALIDAAQAWGVAAEKKAVPAAYPAELLPIATASHSAAKIPDSRPTSAEGELALMELGLRQFAAYPAGWLVVADLGKAGKLSESQKHRWADVTQRLCGTRHMDFALTILTPMIETVADINEQSALWDQTFTFVQSRPDLAADVRKRQAKMWEKHDDLPRAGQCYQDILQHFINDGPFALPALNGAESVLRKMGQERRTMELYAQAAKLVVKPDLMGGTWTS